MTSKVSALWQTDLPDNIDYLLNNLFAESAAKQSPVEIFFRADDIGRLDSSFIEMIELFFRYNMPLCSKN